MIILFAFWALLFTLQYRFSFYLWSSSHLISTFNNIDVISLLDRYELPLWLSLTQLVHGHHLSLHLHADVVRELALHRLHDVLLAGPYRRRELVVQGRELVRDLHLDAHWGGFALKQLLLLVQLLALEVHSQVVIARLL